MIKNFINDFKNIDKLTMKIMKNGLKFCFVLGIISLITLITYEFSFTIPLLFTIGLALFKISLTFGIEFVICGFAADKIKKQLS